MFSARFRSSARPIPTRRPSRSSTAAPPASSCCRRCTSCKKVHWYPRSLCPFCFGDCEWVEASGKGKIYTYSVMTRAETPYAIGYVTLEEGPSMMTNFVDCDFAALKIGQDVKLKFVPSEGGPPMPMFAPV